MDSKFVLVIGVLFISLALIALITEKNIRIKDNDNNLFFIWIFPPSRSTKLISFFV